MHNINRRSFPRPIALLLLLSLGACGVGDASEGLTIVSYNVQNLFDAVDDGTEYRDFDPQHGWGDRMAFTRMERAANAVLESDASGRRPGPDVVLFQEIENRNVLTLLRERFLERARYTEAVLVPKPQSAVHVAVLSRLALRSVRSHSVGLAEARTRDLLEVVLESESGDIAILVAHWKSKSGGAEQTEGLRRAQAKLAVRVIHELHSQNPRLPIILAGDLNENLDEAERVNGAYPVAIGGEIAPTSRPDRVAGSAAPPRLFSPWFDSLSPGSYVHQGRWETIDHFFLNESLFDGIGVEYEGFQTIYPEGGQDGAGAPLAWAPHRDYGLSDHFPILLRLELR